MFTELKIYVQKKIITKTEKRRFVEQNLKIKQKILEGMSIQFCLNIRILTIILEK